MDPSAYAYVDFYGTIAINSVSVTERGVKVNVILMASRGRAVPTSTMSDAEIDDMLFSHVGSSGTVRPVSVSLKQN